MRLTRVRAADFRNLAFADVDLDAPRVFLVGPNGQGKTNLIEAAGLVTALRSFRSAEIAPLVRLGAAEARVRIDAVLGDGQASHVEVTLAKGRRRAVLDGAAPVGAADLIRRFPTVAFCSEDLRLVRGSPGNRRRWLDQALCGTDAGYLAALRDYGKGVDSRNALLRSGHAPDDELEAIERAMLAPALALAAARATALAELTPEVHEICGRAGFLGLAGLRSEPNTPSEELGETWRQGRAADRLAESTRCGPHKDDFTLLFREELAADYASEGQQRLIALALCLAQLRRAARRAGTPPVILADDVLGELDAERRRAFWEAVGDDHQILATGTAAPSEGSWRVLEVRDGRYQPR